MKIQDTLNQLSRLRGRVEVDEKKTTEARASIFHTQLKVMSGQNYEERLAAMLDQISKQGERLSEHIDIKELKRYKKLISEFLYEAVNNSHKFHKDSMLDRRGRHRVYAVINKVNEHLEHLTQEVLKEEKSNIKILQKLDDIRGLLLDILM